MYRIAKNFQDLVIFPLITNFRDKIFKAAQQFQEVATYEGLKISRIKFSRLDKNPKKFSP